MKLHIKGGAGNSAKKLLHTLTAPLQSWCSNTVEGKCMCIKHERTLSTLCECVRGWSGRLIFIIFSADFEKDRPVCMSMCGWSWRLIFVIFAADFCQRHTQTDGLFHSFYPTKWVARKCYGNVVE